MLENLILPKLTRAEVVWAVSTAVDERLNQDVKDGNSYSYWALRQAGLSGNEANGSGFEPAQIDEYLGLPSRAVDSSIAHLLSKSGNQAVQMSVYKALQTHFRLLQASSIAAGYSTDIDAADEAFLTGVTTDKQHAFNFMNASRVVLMQEGLCREHRPNLSRYAKAVQTGVSTLFEFNPDYQGLYMGLSDIWIADVMPQIGVRLRNGRL